jgi:hypothetical protein
MKGIFLISETFETIELHSTFTTLKEAKKELMNQINILANHESANEIQPTMNFKNRFNFFIGKEKRSMVISNFYSSERMSLRMLDEAKRELKNFSKPVN